MSIVRKIALTTTMAAACVALVATTADAVGEPAVTVKGTLCSMAGSDADGNQIDGGIGVVALKVENGSTAVLNCIAGPGTLTNLSGRTQTYRDFQCFIRSPVSGARLETYDTNATVTVDGAGQATCRYSKR